MQQAAAVLTVRPFAGHGGAAGWAGVVAERARGEAMGCSGEAGEAPAEVTVNLAPSAPRGVGWRGESVPTRCLFV